MSHSNKSNVRITQRIIETMVCVLVLQALFYVMPGLPISQQVWAEEVFVWEDEQGNKHFGDKPPEKVDVDVQQEHYEIHNRDSGYPYTDPDLYKNQTETLLEKKKRERAERQVKQQQLREAMKGPCDKARERLAKLDGPVMYFDDNGVEIKKSDAYREQEHAALEEDIAKYCR